MDYQLLLEIISQWIDDETSSMVRALLSLTFFRAKNDPSNYVARIISGVPQGALSSPVLFNMYIDALATNTEASEQFRSGNGAVIMVADDVLLQAKFQQHLQGMIAIAKEWQTERKAN